MNASDAFAWGQANLAPRNLAESRRDCRLLLSHAVGQDVHWLHLNQNSIIPGKAFALFKELVQRRADGVPVQYLTGATEFFGYEFKVAQGVFIPRPETELLVEEALRILGAAQFVDTTWGQSNRRTVVHEVGTGSGAIAISIARHAPRAGISASDISGYALDIARENARQFGVAHQIQFHRGDLQVPLPGSPDLVVANLPYISREIDATLPREVRIQPRSSLLSGRKGLSHIARLISALRIKSGGRVVLEIGFDQLKSVREICAKGRSLQFERVVKDYAGLDRIAVIAAG